MPLQIFGLGVPELLIILAVLLLLFGGSRLAGLGKSTGRALKEFKEETKGIKGGEETHGSTATPTSTTPPQATGPGPYTASSWTPPTDTPPPASAPDTPTDVRRDV